MFSVLPIGLQSLFDAYGVPVATARFLPLSLSDNIILFICECLDAVESNMYAGRGGSDCLY